MKKVLITGKDGFLGARLAQYYKQKYKILAYGHQELDICNLNDVKKVLEEERPDYVVHCAAISDTGYAQNNPEKAYEINVNGTKNIASICETISAKLIYMSSDQVYNGCKNLQALPENVELQPETVYGVQKLKMEQMVQKICPSAVGLRLTWMYDLPDGEKKVNSNLLWNILRAQQQGTSLCFPTREFRGITWVQDVVANMEKAMQLPGGIYNFGSDSSKCTYDMAIFTAKCMQIQNVDKILQKDEKRYPEHIRNLRMHGGKINEYGILFDETEKGIERCLKFYGFE